MAETLNTPSQASRAEIISVRSQAYDLHSLLCGLIKRTEDLAQALRREGAITTEEARALCRVDAAMWVARDLCRSMGMLAQRCDLEEVPTELIIGAHRESPDRG